MDKIFLDTNVFIDIIANRQPQNTPHLYLHNLYISTLSVHITAYVLKIKIPNPKYTQIIQTFQINPLTISLTHQSLKEPTPDYEDNLQLNSALASQCPIFLTHDQHLLSLSIPGLQLLTPTAFLTNYN